MPTHPLPGIRTFWPLAKAVSRNFCPPICKFFGYLVCEPHAKPSFLLPGLPPISLCPFPISPASSCPVIHLFLPRIKIRKIRQAPYPLNVSEPGPDGILPIAFKISVPGLACLLRGLFCFFPQSFYLLSPLGKLMILRIPELRYFTDPVNHRPISLTPIISKAFWTFISDRRRSFLVRQGLLSDRQCDFRSQGSTNDPQTLISHSWLALPDNLGETPGFARCL